METGSLKEKIIELRKEGKSYNEIENEIHCSPGYISEICKSVKLNDIGLDKSKKLTADEISDLKIFYRSHSKKETAEKFGVSTTTVTKYKDNKRVILSDDEKKKNNYNKVKCFRNKTKEKAVEYKGGKCVVCGYNKCISAFDFHHLDPNKKKFGISRNCNRAWEKIKDELDKCVLLCSNCHRELHSGIIKLDYRSIG